MSIVYVPGLNHPEMFGKNGDIIVHSKGLGAQGLAFKNVPENDGNLYVRTLKHLLATTDLEAMLLRMSAVDGDSDQVTCGVNTVAILGEVFGKGVQDLDYGTSKPEFRVFDVKVGDAWFSDEALDTYVPMLPKVPVLYRGPFDVKALEEHRDGVTTVGGTNVREGIVVTNADNRIISCNRAFEEITGYRADEVRGKTPAVLKSGRHDAEFYRQIWQSIAATGAWRGEIWNRHRSGDLVAVQATVSAVRDENGRISHFIDLFSDVTDRKTQQERIEHLAGTCN